MTKRCNWIHLTVIAWQAVHSILPINPYGMNLRGISSQSRHFDSEITFKLPRWKLPSWPGRLQKYQALRVHRTFQFNDVYFIFAGEKHLKVSLLLKFNPERERLSLLRCLLLRTDRTSSLSPPQNPYYSKCSCSLEITQ